MTTQTLADLRRLYYGGGSDAEYAAMQAAAAAGVTAATLLSDNSAPGKELGYAEITANFATAAFGAAVDIPGLTTIVQAGARPIEIEVAFPTWSCNTVNFGVALQILEDGAQIQQGSATEFLAGALAEPLRVKVRRNPAAGQHTYKARALVLFGNGAQTVTLQASPTAPAYISVLTR